MTTNSLMMVCRWILSKSKRIKILIRWCEAKTCVYEKEISIPWTDVPVDEVMRKG